MKTNEQRKELPRDIGEIFERASERARRMGLDYAGAVTPAEAHAPNTATMRSSRHTSAPRLLFS